MLKFLIFVIIIFLFNSNVSSAQDSLDNSLNDHEKAIKAVNDGEILEASQIPL